jgi:hypothetical protein
MVSDGWAEAAYASASFAWPGRIWRVYSAVRAAGRMKRRWSVEGDEKERGTVVGASVDVMVRWQSVGISCGV